MNRTQMHPGNIIALAPLYAHTHTMSIKLFYFHLKLFSIIHNTAWRVHYTYKFRLFFVTIAIEHDTLNGSNGGEGQVEIH